MEDFSKYEKLNELKESLTAAIELFDSKHSYSANRSFYHRMRSSYFRTTGKAYPRNIKSLYHSVIEARTILANLKHFNSLTCVSRDEIEFAEKFTAEFVEDYVSKEHELVIEIIEAETDFNVAKIKQKKRNRDLTIAAICLSMIILAAAYLGLQGI
uniref:Uncharacterized protein n=1 Tax=Rhizobium phage IG49 TaxID=3129228 RepID=A0AAU8HZE5_9CAUD